MAVNQELQGKTYPAHVYEVGKEKIGEYARAVGEENRIYFDAEAAKGEGFDGVVAPPMFAVVYQAGALGAVIVDPALGINLMMMVHGEQEFVWHNSVLAGDTITTEATIDSVYEKAGMDFVVLKAESKNQDGEPVVTGTATLVVRRAG